MRVMRDSSLGGRSPLSRADVLPVSGLARSPTPFGRGYPADRVPSPSPLVAEPRIPRTDCPISGRHAGASRGTMKQER
jgi:hypothetical protein